MGLLTDLLGDGNGTSALVGAKVHLTAAESLATGAVVSIPWDATSWDTDSFWSAGSPTVLTVPSGKAGVYQANFGATFSANSTGRRVLRISHNGALVARVDAVAVSAANSSLFTSAQMQLAVGDTVRFEAFQDSGSTLTVVVDASHPNGASLQLLGTV